MAEAVGVNNGKLIVIESGSDGSGKATQTQKLYERLKCEGKQVRKIEFPNYQSDSSALIKMYLNGDFGNEPDDVNPYVASAFFAVDRYASFRTDWGEFLRAGGIILADRYTTSNMVHQCAKITEQAEKDKFLDWLWELEFNKFGLPVPNCVIYLNVPPQISKELMVDRANKFSGTSEKDIHESNDEYLIESYNQSIYIAEKYNWLKINCVKNNKLKTVDEIHTDIYHALLVNKLI